MQLVDKFTVSRRWQEGLGALQDTGNPILLGKLTKVTLKSSIVSKNVIALTDGKPIAGTDQHCIRCS